MKIDRGAPVFWSELQLGDLKRPYGLMWVKWFGWVEEKKNDSNMQGGLKHHWPIRQIKILGQTGAGLHRVWDKVNSLLIRCDIQMKIS